MLEDSLLISGIDLVDQTPIIDIKPYHEMDFLNEEERGIPQWIEEAKSERLEVIFTESSE